MLSPVMGEPLDGRKVSAQWKIPLYIEAVSVTLPSIRDS
jgi:hypothetical protein